MNQSTLAKLALTVAVAIGAVGFFFYSSQAHTTRYKMVDQVTTAPQEWVGKNMQIHGWVEAGSIHEDIIDQQTVRTFILENNGERLLVRNTGPKPDSFRDRSEVVAEGKLVEENGQTVLIASNLMAKCPSKYQGAQKDKLFDH
ncbi:MAG TPA: cytochrome c maturation protein CcmE [Kofleriaceae bacterium]|nr:cytochrome c maturation protein CcmE [Kofleriaceae bacterium]